MTRMLIFMHHIAIASHALHILTSTHIYAYAGRLRGVEIRNSSSASLMDVRRSRQVVRMLILL
jgi:hypothetical protein